MKLLVKTVGSFQLLLTDVNPPELIRHDGISVVTAGTSLLQERISLNQVEVVAKVGHDATQADWDDTLKQSDGEEDLAVASFEKEFPVKKADEAGVAQPLPSTKLFGGPANPSGQTGGLAPDVKPGAPGTTEGPGGPKDTNVPAKSHATKR